MMRLKSLLVAVFIFSGIVGATSVLTASQTYAASDARGGASDACNPHFLSFPTWYRGLTNSDCSLKSPTQLGGDQSTQVARYIWIIVLNIIEIALQLVLYVSVTFILYGGFMYITSVSDNSTKVTNARKTIQNAIIGLVLSFASIMFVNLVAGYLK